MKKNVMIRGNRRAKSGMTTLEIVMLTAIAALLIVGIAYMMKKSATDANKKVDDVTNVQAGDILPGSESMVGSGSMGDSDSTGGTNSNE